MTYTNSCFATHSGRAQNANRVLALDALLCMHKSASDLSVIKGGEEHMEDIVLLSKTVCPSCPTRRHELRGLGAGVVMTHTGHDSEPFSVAVSPDMKSCASEHFKEVLR